MPPTERLICWEALDPNDPVLNEVRRLYESTQAEEERIPWAWVERAVVRRQQWRPGQWSPHLILSATQAGKPVGPVTGFVYGSHVPDYGGYVCYLGVDPGARKGGQATRLFRQIFRVIAVDAGAEGVPLPFTIWESHRPEPGAPEEAWALWSARLRLFARVGAWWVSGVDFQSPNFGDEDGPPVPLQLFLVPGDTPLEAFTPEYLRGVVAGLHGNVYGNGPGDDLYDLTMRPGVELRLRPPLEAERK